jgi:hypothetical protein
MIGAIVSDTKWKKIRWLTAMMLNSGDSIVHVSRKQLEKVKFDFLIQNGMKKPERPDNRIYIKVEKFHKQTNIPILIRELPVLRQIATQRDEKTVPEDDRWVRLCWNSFYNDEGLHPYDPSWNRWEDLVKEHNIVVHDWQRRGDAVLFNLQLDGDSALNRLKNYKDFCIKTINGIKKFSDRPIIVRCHPRDRSVYFELQKEFPDLEFSNKRPLYDDLDRSWCMVTYNSTSCVESVLYGTPTITLDPSAIAWPITWHSVKHIENNSFADREFWCRRIAFMQWKGTELHDGYVWQLMKSLIEDNVRI